MPCPVALMKLVGKLTGKGGAVTEYSVCLANHTATEV